MLRFLSFFVLTFVSFSVNAQVNADWIVRHGAYTTDRGTALAVDKQSNLIAAGVFTDTLALAGQTIYGLGFLDSYVSKLDSNGNYFWLTHIKGPKDDVVTNVVTLDNGDVIATGTFADSVEIGTIKSYAQANDDVWLARLDATDGSPLWLISAGSYFAYERVGGLAVNPDYIYWAINFGSDLIIGDDTVTAQGFNDASVAIYDFNGNYQGVNTLTGSGNDNITDIACNEFGQVFAAGRFNGIFYGDTAAGNFDLFYTLLFGGEPVWMKTFGGAGSESITALTRDAQNNIYLAGIFVDTLQLEDTTLLPDAVGSDQVFVMRVDLNGNPNWYFVGFPDSGADYITDIAVACNGDLLFTGLTTYFANESPQSPQLNSTNLRCQFGDTYLARMNENGELLWIKNTLGTNLNSGTALASDSAGHVYITGYFTDSLYLFNAEINGRGGNDAFLFRITDTVSCLPEIIDTIDAIQNALVDQRAIIFPNPSDGYSFIFMNTTQPTHVTLTDVTGKMLDEANVSVSTNPIPLFQLFGKLEPSIYFVTVDDGRSRQTLKWVIAR